MSDGKVVFAAKYGDWISIRKIWVDPETRPEEVAALLVGVRQSIDRKLYDLLGVDEPAVEEFAKRLTKGKRKGFSSVSDVFSAMGPEAYRVGLSGACPPEALPAAKALLAQKVLEELKMSPEIDAKEFNKAFPNAKIAKPRGNFGKKKKK